MSRYDTHTVENQPPELRDYDVFSDDTALREALEREGGEWAMGRAQQLGQKIGSGEVIDHARLANANPPELHTHDRYGHRVDEVELHPSWHAMMRLGIENALHALPWSGQQRGHVGRAALYYLFNQGENGCACPITMTFAVVPALRHQPDVAELWEPRVLSSEYDERFVPAGEKRGAIMGMAMTEKQGGSDVRANTTRAEAINGGGPGGEYALTGHKWFCSSPQADAFLTLAHTEEGLSCFLVPRFTPDGEKNRFFIQRLKSKLGNRSNPSSEVEYDRTWARMVGEPGRGVPTIINMVHHTRLDCVLGSAGMMRLALVNALHHAKHRRAFGKRLIEQPLMQNVLADLCIEMEATVALMMRLARAFDDAPTDPAEAALARVLAPIAKYWVCKRNTPMVYEALECHGGNGYVEEAPIARLFRDAPLNGIWEGSGNVICLDVLRALRRTPDAGEALVALLRSATGQNRIFDGFLSRTLEQLQRSDAIEARARTLVESLALATQASLLLRHAPESVSQAFCVGRIDREGGSCFGTLPSGTDFPQIIQRSTTI